MREHTFVRRVALALGGSDDRAHEVSLVVLAALSTRLGAAESEHLATRLPPDLAHVVRRDRRGLPRLEPPMVVSRVADELGCELAAAVKMIFAVYAVVEEVIAEPAPYAEARATS